MDFETGKLIDVSRHLRARRSREYALLWLLLALTSAPYWVAAWYRPWATLAFALFLAYFQTVITYVTSASTDTAHHIRALLAGSNPIGMTGGSSLLFAAVDLVFDWSEDCAARKKNPIRYWGLVVHKFAMTPIGVVLMVLEYTWDTILLGRPGLVRHKWHELFALANFHNLVCPEKSNDLFYADLALARYQRDLNLYQWNRMRAMVFELKQYSRDVEHGIGVPETNLFVQDEVSAYQTLKRLQIEIIEQNLEAHYEEHIDEFPVPPTLAMQLVKNAQPIQHYIRMKRRLLENHHLCSATTGVPGFLARQVPRHLGWHVLRLLDHGAEPLTADVSSHIRQHDLLALADASVLDIQSDGQFGWKDQFRSGLKALIENEYVEANAKEVAEEGLQRVPHVVNCWGKAFVKCADG